MERGPQRPIEVPPEWKTLIGGEERRLVEVIEDLVERLDGSTSLEQALGSALLGGIDAELLAAAAGVLEGRGLLRYADVSADSDFRSRYASQIRLFSSMSSVNASSSGGDGVSAQHALNTARILITGLARISELVAHHLSASSQATVYRIAAETSDYDIDDDDHARSDSPAVTEVTEMISTGSIDLVIASSAANDLDDLLAINAACIDHATPLLTYRSSSLRFEIGPLIIPGETACYRCLLLRERSAAGVEDLTLIGSSAGGNGHLNFALGADLLALEAIRWLAGLGAATRSRTWRFDLPTGSTHFSPVLKLPRCPACGVHRVFPDRRLWEE